MSQSQTPLPDREQIANLEVGQTNITHGMCVVLTATFLAVICAVPLAQQGREWLALRAEGKSEWPQAFSIFAALPAAANDFLGNSAMPLVDRIFSANGVLLRAASHYETELEDRSFLAEYFIPRVQQFTSRWLGLGNEQVYLGREGWLYYRPGVDYLTGPGFLDPAFQKRRSLTGDASVGAAVQPDPVAAIVDFKNQLAERNIHLILMPIPDKAMVEPEFLSPRYPASGGVPLQNPSYPAFLAALNKEGVDVLDVTDALWQDKQSTGQPQYLKTDTHWTPEAMQRAASLLAEKIQGLESADSSAPIALETAEKAVEAPGDIAAMLKLPEGSDLYPSQKVSIRPVRSAADGQPWTADPSASVLLLGDSFSNIYSLEPLGWGASAGLTEQLSLALRQPVDALLRNDAGAHATRELLVKDAAQGRDRLAVKKLVVWQFAMRELAVGDWKILKIPAVENSRPDQAATAGEGFLVPAKGEAIEVEGTVADRSSTPRPGTVPYKDQIFSVHLTGITGGKTSSSGEAVVYLFGMKDNQLTPVSTWKVGDRVKLKLRPWADVASEYERFNRSELEDETLMLAEPNWGEPLK
jgi:alginate O-acetyltransferase complex protein AlgJ